LYEAMKQLAADPDLCTALGKAGAAFVTAHYDQQVVWGELLKEYASTLAGGE
jgi:glycosyltransferase involved in cell wall biosynthesis